MPASVCSKRIVNEASHSFELSTLKAETFRFVHRRYKQSAPTFSMRVVQLFVTWPFYYAKIAAPSRKILCARGRGDCKRKVAYKHENAKKQLFDGDDEEQATICNEEGGGWRRVEVGGAFSFLTHVRPRRLLLNGRQQRARVLKNALVSQNARAICRQCRRLLAALTKS